MFQVPPLPELKLTVVEAPGSIQLEEPFTVSHAGLPTQRMLNISILCYVFLLYHDQQTAFAIFDETLDWVLVISSTCTCTCTCM